MQAQAEKRKADKQEPKREEKKENWRQPDRLQKGESRLLVQPARLGRRYRPLRQGDGA
jgi:hypothetical protein